MTIEDDKNSSASALSQARRVSQALTEAARRARFSTRSRRAFSSGGFEARRGARAARIFVWLSFFVVAAAPSLAGGVYYGWIASNQYIAEAQFTVMGGEPPAADGIATMTGIPAAAIIQDTQIVTNYIESRAAVEKLEAAVDLRRIYSKDDADFVARFDPKKPIEKLVRYWQGMTDASIIMPAGIVRFRVRAFTPTDAQSLGETVIAFSEQLVNDLNRRMLSDAVRDAESELERTGARLAAARAALEKARNEEGVLDVEKTAESLNQLITDLKTNLAKMQQEYDAQLHEVSSNAPQIRTLKARIDASRDQIADLEAKLTSAGVLGAQDRALSNTMSRFAELDLERQIAERLYAGAASSLEVARLVAEHKLMYLNTFVHPQAPQESRYPHRLLYAAGIAVCSLAAWGALCGALGLVRNNMA